MENQPIINSSDISSVNSVPVDQSPVPQQTKTNLLIPMLLTVLVSAVIFGMGGYYLGKQSAKPQQDNYASSSITPTPITESAVPTATPIATESPADLKTYTNKQLGISFQYPSTYELLDKTGGGYDVYLFSSKTQQQSFEKCLVDKTPECNVYNLGIRFILQDKSANQSLEQFYTSIGGTDLNKAQKTTIDGHAALIFEGEGIGLIHTTYIDLGEDAFEIFGNAIVDDQKNMSTYREIVKTFKINR